MFKLDNDFLTSLGLGSLPVDEKNKLLQAIYERLEMNVGMRLAEKMTDAQLDEFEGFIDRNDEAGALRWLETNFPNYKDVVADELEKLKGEISASAPHILAAAQQNPTPGVGQQVAQPGQSVPQMPPQPPNMQTQPSVPQQPYQMPSQPDNQPSPYQPAPTTPEPQQPPAYQPAPQVQPPVPPTQSDPNSPPFPNQQPEPFNPGQPPFPGAPPQQPSTGQPPAGYPPQQ